MACFSIVETVNDIGRRAFEVRNSQGFALARFTYQDDAAKRLLQLACWYLRDQVRAGAEYPDAHTSAVMRFGVDGDQLAALYDIS